MIVQGRDCVIRIRLLDKTITVPFSEETVREEAALVIGETDREVTRQVTGMTGCIVTPLTLETAPLLLGLALGELGVPVFVSETRNLYRHELCLLPMEDGPEFEIFQERGIGRRYPGCRVTGFEFRIRRDGEDRESAIKLKLDIGGSGLPESYAVTETAEFILGERFKEDGVTYAINGKTYTGIYGVTITAKKAEPGKAEIWIHRILGKDDELPAVIENFAITARLFRERYQCGSFGMFRLSLSRLVLIADETTVDCAGPVIGPLRFYVAGDVRGEVFTERDLGLGTGD
jgi:hypothetical protein